MKYNKIVSMLLCFLFVGCTVAPTDTEMEEQTSEVSEVMEEETKDNDTDEEAMMEEDMIDEESMMVSGEIDEDASSISFVGGSSIVDHPGMFTRFDVELVLSENDPSNFEDALLEVIVDIASVKTDNERLDEHLMKEDFFDVENHPQAMFQSTAIEQLDDSTYLLKGGLTIKGTTKNVTLEATIDNEMISISYNLPRKEFGIGNDSYGDKLLDELIPVEAELMFEKLKEAADDEEEEDMDIEE